MGLVNKVVRRPRLDAAVKDGPTSWHSDHRPRSRSPSALQRQIDNIRGISNFALHSVKLFYDTAESKEGVAAFTRSANRTSTSSRADGCRGRSIGS